MSSARRHPAEQADTSLALRCVAAENELERLRAVLRSLISCGSTSPTITAMAMNTLEAGSGDAWLARRSDSNKEE